MWVVMYREDGKAHMKFRFYGLRDNLKDELDVFKRFTEETKHD